MKKHIALLSLLCFVLMTACAAKNDQGTFTPEEITGDVEIYVTTANHILDFKKQAIDFDKKTDAATLQIQLRPSERYQTMDGFGAAITGSTCYNLLKMSQADRTRFLKETFSPTEGMGYSYIRIAIGCSDFSLSEYTCCDAEGIEHFALTNEETNYIIPMLKEILDINPDIKLMGSPWTCPRWMKVNNLTDRQPHYQWTSGQLNPAYYQDYGAYFVKWIQAFAGNGIPIYSVTPQNEPLNRGNSASLYMEWEEQRDFVNTALVPQLKAAGLATKVYLFDHNYNYDNLSDQNDYPAKIYAADVDDMVAGAAYHDYGGDRSELNDIHAKYPDKELLFTETSIGTWNDGKNFEKRLIDDMADIALGTVNNWCRAVMVWNLMLDSERGPNRNGGCQTCYGAVDINKSDYKTISRNSHYYIIGHLSAVVKPGATRIGASGDMQDEITYAAFENADSSYALVVLNSAGENKKIAVNSGIRRFTYSVPAKSVVSFHWK
jgi:glucosylceramidase